MRRYLPAAAGSLIVVLVGAWMAHSMARRVPAGEVSNGSAPRPSARPHGMPKLIPIEATLFASPDQALRSALAQGALSDTAAWERLSALAEAGEAERLMACRLVCPDGKLLEHAEAVSEVSEVVGGRLEFHPARLVDPEYETLTLGHHLSVLAQWTSGFVRIGANLDSREAAGDSRVEYFDALDPLSGERAEVMVPQFRFLDMIVGADLPPGETVLVAVTWEVATPESEAPGRTHYLFLKADQPDWPNARELPAQPRAGWRVDEFVIDLPADAAIDRLQAREDSRADGEWLQAALADPEASLIIVQRASVTAAVFTEQHRAMGDRARAWSRLSISEAANWDSTEGAPMERVDYGPGLDIGSPTDEGPPTRRMRLVGGIDLPGPPREWRVFADHPAPVIRTTSRRTSSLSTDILLPTSGVRLVAATPTPNHFSFDESPPMQRLTFVRSVFHGGDETPPGPQEPDEELQWAAISLPQEVGTALSEVRNDPERAARLVWEAVAEGMGRLSFFTAQAGNNSNLQSGVTSTCPEESVNSPDPDTSGYYSRMVGLSSEKERPRSHDPFEEKDPSAEKGPPSLDIGFPVAADRHPVVADLLAIVKEDQAPFYPESFEFDPDSIPLPENVGRWSLGSIQPAEAPPDTPEHGRWMAILVRRVPGA